jgi:secondary thiamine-phosphate synthase enzyme
MWLQKPVRLKSRPRGFHLVSDEILCAIPEVRQVETGLLHIFIQHSSASLTLNENADPSVRQDFETVFNRLVPEQGNYLHRDEGPDDLPAHIKSSLLGASVSIPVSGGRLLLGTWQGIYLCEHRDHAGSRRLVLTLQGEQ